MAGQYLRAGGNNGMLFTLFLLAFWGNTNIFPVSRTLGGLGERLNVGKGSPAIRETASSVYHIRGHRLQGG